MPEFRRLAEQANRSGVTVHTIGAEGLVNPAFRDAAAPRLAAVALSKPSCNLVRDDCDALEDLSTETGGFHVHRSNDLAVAARAIRRSSAAYYAIGATLATAPKDGSGYRVELASQRPGVTVRVRRRAVARDAADEAREAAEAASLFGDGPTDIAVELTLRPAARTAGARSRRDVPFALRVPVDALTFEPGPTGRSADLELTFIAADARGDVSPPAVVNVPVRIPDSDWESRRGATWPYESVFRARKETRRFTVIVRDVRSNRLGAAEVATSLD